jgi:chromate transport protein ChrA
MTITAVGTRGGVRVRSVLPHLPFLGVLAVAVWIRAVAVLAYPAPLWFGDSPGYLEAAIRFRPDETRPSGYPILLWLLKPFHSFGLMVSVQHAVGVLTGVLVYVLVWRAGRAAWPVPDDRRRSVWLPGTAAALLTVPVLIPVHQIALEHMLMSDSLFAFLLLAAVTAVLWRRRPTWWLGALAGVLTACASLTRTAGLPLVALILAAMLIRRAGWRACAAAAVAFVLPVAGYLVWFHAEYGQYKLAKADQVFLYGRTAAFADCRVIRPRPELAIMCPERSDPRISRSFSVMWTPDSPFRRIPGWVYGEDGNRLAGEFAWAAIKAQPVDYAEVVVRDTLRAFTWHRQPYPTPWTWLQYEFPEGEAWSDRQARLAGRYGGDGETRVVRPWAGQVLAYQDHVVMPGTILGVLLLAGLAGAVPHARSNGRWRLARPVRHWAAGALLPWGTSLALLVIPAATADFDYRYVMPAVPFACVALGLALFPSLRPQPVPPPREEQRPPSRAKIDAESG